MNDYTNYKSQPDYIGFSGKTHFNNQLNQEGSYITVNEKDSMLIDDVETKYKAIVRIYNNEYSESKEERIVLFDKRYDIDKGSLVNFLDEDYLVYTHRDKDNPFMDTVKMCICNETLNAKGWEKTIPCRVEGESYGVKIIANNEFRQNVDTKVAVTVQDNDFTRKIQPNTRFIFNRSEHGVYEIGDITVYVRGLITFICRKSEYRQEDDLENNIAFNGIVKEETDSQTYAISGQEEIKKGKSYIYTITPENENVTWEVSDTTSAEIKTENGQCTLTPLKREDYIVLTAKIDGVIVDTKDIYLL